MRLLTLNRSEKRNAISAEMMEEILAALGEVERSPARVGTLTGAGKAFCAGMDLDALQQTPFHYEPLWDDARKG